jgi:hypothetical protein
MRLALFVALILSSGAFVLLSGEAWAQQQQPTAPHQPPPPQQPPEMPKQQMVPTSGMSGMEEYPAEAVKGVAEPVDQEATLAVPPAVTSLPTKLPPKPVGSASEPTPKPALEKTTNTPLSGDPKKPTTEKTVATKPGDALPEEESLARVLVRPVLEPERVPGGPDPAPPTPAPISASASKPPPETTPEPFAPEQSDPLLAPDQGERPAASRGVGPAALLPGEEEHLFSGSMPPPEGDTPADDSAAAPIGPILAPSSYPPTGVSVWAVEEEVGGGLSRVSSSFETAANAVSDTVGSAMKAARSATTSAAAQVLQTLANGAAPESSSDVAQGSRAQEEGRGGTTQPPSQPPAPLVPPVGDGLLYSSSGTGQAGPASGFVVLLLGVLASGLALLVWRGGSRSLASWEVPKPTSALLLPLERPG